MSGKQVDPQVESRLTALLVQKMKYQKRIILIDLEINQMILGTTVEGQDADEPTQPDDDPEEKFLEVRIHELLLETPMALKDLVAEILRAGYKTKSKNFSSVVQQAIQRLIKVSAVKHDEKTRKYKGLTIEEKVLRHQLGRLQENKRRPRSQKTE